MKTSLNFIISNINKNIIDLSATLKELKELQKLECLNQPEITEQDYLKIIKKFPKYNTLSIEDLKNRKQLVLSRKNFTDISPLRNLFNLRYLNLELNNITDISPLRNLNKLKKLNLSCNNISDISFLKNLYNLKYLNIWNNPIKRNKIYELEVALPNCEIFIGIRWINGNIISMNKIQIKKCYPYSLPNFKECSYTHELDMKDMLITDISSLKNLINLKLLKLGSNQISDIFHLKNLTQLKGLHLESNQISDIFHLKNLTQLKSLHLGRNQISDISPLKNLVNLEFLVLWFNQISELSPLQDLINLKHLFLSDNKISDISPLKNLVNLKTIDLIDNFIPLQQIEELKKALPNCRISCNSTTIKLWNLLLTINESMITSFLMNKFQIKKCYPYNLYKFTTQFTFFTIPTYMQHLMCDFAVLPIGNNFSCAKEFPFIFDFRIHITSEDDVFSEKDALLIKHAKTLAIEDSYHEIDISFLMMFENLEELYFIDSCIVGDFFEIIKTLKHLKKLEVYKSGIYSPSREPTFDLMNRLQKVLPNCEVEYV